MRDDEPKKQIMDMTAVANILWFDLMQPDIHQGSVWCSSGLLASLGHSVANCYLETSISNLSVLDRKPNYIYF